MRKQIDIFLAQFLFPNRVGCTRAHSHRHTLKRTLIMIPLVAPLESSEVGDMVGEYVQLVPSEHAGAINGAIDDIIDGAIVGVADDEPPFHSGTVEDVEQQRSTAMWAGLTTVIIKEAVVTSPNAIFESCAMCFPEFARTAPSQRLMVPHREQQLFAEDR